MPRRASPGFYRFALGEVEITVLSDGHFHFPMELVAVDDPLELQAYGVESETREEYFRSRLVPFDHISLQASSSSSPETPSPTPTSISSARSGKISSTSMATRRAEREDGFWTGPPPTRC